MQLFIVSSNFSSPVRKCNHFVIVRENNTVLQPHIISDTCVSTVAVALHDVLSSCCSFYTDVKCFTYSIFSKNAYFDVFYFASVTYL